MDPIPEILDETYEPVEPNSYSYNAISNLPSNIDDLLDINKTYKVNICAFEVNNEYKYPFLKYLLSKPKTSNQCYFPSFSIISEDIITKATSLIKQILDNVSERADSLLFSGFKTSNNNIYIFFDCTTCNIKQPELLWSATNIWFAIMDEIVNTKTICNVLIDECVTQLFVENNDLCYLQNRKDENYILPVIAYVSRHEPKLHFTFVFGVSKSLNKNILGDYYYFTNYKNSFHTTTQMKVNEDLSESLFKRGIVRFALFMEKTKRIENTTGNPLDDETLLADISDHDGTWATDYDSAYIGNPLSDDMKDTPIIVVRDYEQQVPLSYHYTQNIETNHNFDII